MSSVNGVPRNNNHMATFVEDITRGLEDPVTSELMTEAVDLIGCGHTFNESTVVLLSRDPSNYLCSLCKAPIKEYQANYAIRSLAERVSLIPPPEEPKTPDSKTPSAPTLAELEDDGRMPTYPDLTNPVPAITTAIAVIARQQLEPLLPSSNSNGNKSMSVAAAQAALAPALSTSGVGAVTRKVQAPSIAKPINEVDRKSINQGSLHSLIPLFNEVDRKSINQGSLHSLIPLSGGLLLKHSLGKITVCDLSTNECVQTFDGRFSSVVLLDNGQIATCSSNGANLKIWDPRKGTGLSKLEAGSYKFTALSSMPGGLLAIGNDHGQVVIWDLAKNETIDTLKSLSKSPVRKFALLPEKYLVSLSMDNTVQFWNMNRYHSFKLFIFGNGDLTFKPEATIADIAPLGDNRLAILNGDNSFHIWETSWGLPGPKVECVKSFRYTYPVRSIVPLTGGRYVTVGDDRFTIFLSTGEEKTIKLRHPRMCSFAQLDHHTLVIGDKSGAVKQIKI